MADDEEDINSILDDDDAETKDDDTAGSQTDIDTEDGDGADAEFDMDAKVGHLSRAEIADLSPEEQLAKWADTLLPVEVDLVTGLDASNIFFINVESVIFDLILSKEVPFEEDQQFLRMHHAVEQLLVSMQSCGGVFRLIFFDQTEQLFSAAFGESVWAFRQAFLVHCKSHGIDHAVFPHWYSPEFREHVQMWRPSFFLLAHDAIELEDDEEEEDADTKLKLRGFFQAMILRCLSYRTHVALLRGLQRRGNRIMAFTLEPGYHDSWIDNNVQVSLAEMLEGEEDEEEAEDILAALKDFAKKIGAKDQNLLRSFLVSRFAKTTLAMTKGQNEKTSQLMLLVVKVLVLQEMMVRYIPLDKRAYSTIQSEDWELFEETIAGAVDRFFTMASEDIAKLLRVAWPEDIKFDACDLFDGRLYRHIFQFVVKKGLEDAKKLVGVEAFKLSGYVSDEIASLWSQASSEEFFPVKLSAVKDLPGVEPPELPAKIAPRAKPELYDVKSEFLGYIWKDVEFAIDVKSLEDHENDEILWSRHDWKEGVYLDAVKQQQEMEKNEGEKKMEERMRAKGKISDKDREFMARFALKKRQMALKALHAYSKSLTGSDKLHPPIIITEGKGDDKKKEEPAEKLSKKHQELLEKRKAEEDAKIQEHDAKQSKDWEKPVDALSEVQDPSKLEKDLLDLLVGFGRVTPSFVNFPALSAAFKTPEAQVKIVVKVMKNVRTALKKMQLDRMSAENQPKVRSLIVYVFCLIQEGYNSFAKKGLLDGKGIKLFQECLISIGFPKTAAGMFENWKKAQTPAEEPVKEEKGGKDDKKKGKDDKKKDKKDEKDKKDKKDDKKDKDDDPDSFKVTKDVESVWSGVGPDEYGFQLMYMGPQMSRSVGNAKDPLGRVNFKPDKWQRDLLDIVDSKESSLIVAPTASGKTFIGYYVMDKVLREDHDGVVVYVAPSKALVNQVSAEIYARFSSKTYPPHSKHELLGVFLQEYNSAGGVMEAGKWKHCQVLVTIPYILEMLLLSPSNQDWIARLRYVVLDEVHCIGEQEGGVQWEHSMQLIPCPFIALSATVSDPTFFHNWLSKVNKKKKTSKVNIVEHKERWNDLYKYMWHRGEMRNLHPFCCLIESAVRKGGLSSDLTLVPQEMVQLWQEVSNVLNKKSPTWERLCPLTYFQEKDISFIAKLDAREYEKELKATFLDLLAENTMDSEAFAHLVVALQKSPDLKFQGSEKFNPPPRVVVNEDNTDAAAAEAEVDMRKLGKGTSYLQAATLMKICKDLDKKDIMPAIFFNFSRKEIEKMLQKLIQELKDQQQNKYFGTEEASYRSRKLMERRQADYNQKKKAYDEAMKMKASSKQEANASRKSGENEGRGAEKNERVDTSADMTMAEPLPPVDLMDEIDPDFTFHSPKALGTWYEDIEETLQELKKKKVADWLIDGLRRGVGMHHEGCKKNYKDAVEILFRRGYLRVVFSTGTLAMGINMPCRSTIFCGDSLELNGLMYRQMSGRAGRRGFDLLGQVIFLDMAFGKVQRLVASNLSSLAGEFTLSPTVLLRALHEWELVSLDEAQDKELARSKSDIARCLSPMFSLPFFQSRTAELDTQVAYHTRFSLDLLFKEGLVAGDGSTRGLANLATHLFEAEPANLLFARLLTSGLLHEYLEREAKDEQKGDRRSHLTVKLLSVLAWIFYRRRLPPTIPSLKIKSKRKKHLPSENCPRLPQLPSKIRKEIQKYNTQLFSLFQEFAWAVASTRKIAEGDLTLPLSQREFRTGWDERGEPFEKSSEFAPCIIKQLVRYRSRSPFSALAGVGDTFSSPVDLCKYVRNVLHLDLNQLPTVACPPAAADSDAELEATNSWILDFMIHGKIKYLWEDNGIDATQAWKLISEFTGTLKKATVVLKAFCPADDLVLKTFNALFEEMNKYLKGEGGR